MSRSKPRESSQPNRLRDRPSPDIEHSIPRTTSFENLHASIKPTIPTPEALHGGASALIALSPDVERDLRDFVSGKVKAMAKVGHELIKPTGKKFVFFLHMDEEEKMVHYGGELDEEDKEGTCDYINCDQEDGAGGGEKALNVELKTKNQAQLALPAIEEVDGDEAEIEYGWKSTKFNAKKKHKVQFPLPVSVIEEIDEEISSSDVRYSMIPVEQQQPTDNTTGTALLPTTVSKTENDTTHPRLRRTSNGSSLASLIAIAKASDFEPDDPTPTTTLSDTSLEVSRLQHSSEGPSLAALIASAKDDDFPLPVGSETNIEPVSDLEEAPNMGGMFTSIYEWPYEYAYVVLRERFEAKYEGGGGARAKLGLKKKNDWCKIGSQLKWEILLDGCEIKFEEHGESAAPMPKKFKVKRRERGTWWLDEGLDLRTATESADQDIEQATIEDIPAPEEVCQSSEQGLDQTHTDFHKTSKPPVLEDNIDIVSEPRMIHIRHASMNDIIWSENSSLSTTDRSASTKASSAKSTDTAATEYSQLIEALDLPCLPITTIGIDMQDAIMPSNGKGLATDVPSWKREHEENHYEGPAIRGHDVIGQGIDIRHSEGYPKASHCGRIMVKVKTKARKVRDKVAESTAKVRRSIGTIFGRA